MGVWKTGLSVVTVAGSAALFKLLFYPQTEIVLERHSLEYDLREGGVYTDFLKEAVWETFDEPSIPVASIEDIPIGFDGPVKYKLSPEELAQVCPYTEADLNKGIEVGMQIFKSTSTVAQTIAARGANAVGCVTHVYQPGDVVTEDNAAEFFLHFDSNAHKTLNTKTKKPKFQRVSNFFSNFSSAMFTAPLHAATSSSTVVMCAGVKTWWFLDPSCCNDFGHHMHAGALLGKGFLPDVKLKVLQTEPGDVMTFGNYQHHMVVTEPGPVFMQTYRHFTKDVIWGGIKRYGWQFLKGMLDARATNTKGTTAAQAQPHPMRIHCRNAIDEDDFTAIHGRIQSVFGKQR